MEENKPSTWRPQDDFTSAVDPANPSHRRALAQLAESQILSKSDLLKVLDRLDPNKEQEMLAALVFLGLDLPFTLSSRDFDMFAGKIDPNTLTGSYSALLLESEGMLTFESREGIKHRIDFTRVDSSASSSEFGNVYANLVEGKFLTVAITQNPILSLDRLTLQRGAFN